MRKYGTHGDGMESLNLGDTVSTPYGKTGVITNLVIGTTTRYVVTSGEQESVHDRFELTRVQQ